MTRQEPDRNGSADPMESVITCKDGSTKYIESTLTAIGDQTLIFYTDLTQRRLAEEALHQTHTFNDLLIQTMPFGMDIVDEEGNSLFRSKSLQTMLGDKDLERCCWKAYRDNAQPCEGCPLNNGFSFNKPGTMEVSNVFDGKTFLISYIGMMYEGKRAMLEVFQDITEQKKLQEELLQSQKLLSIGTMAGGIAHDFNNIVGIIIGYVSILHSIKDNEQRFNDSVNAIRHAADRGAGLVRQILTFARKTDVSFMPINIPEMLQELISMLEQTFPKLVTFNTMMDAHLPSVSADHTQVHQALLNLCVNARDAMPNGGEIAIGARVVSGEKLRERFPTAAEEWYECLSVRDHGIGMEESIIRRIFDPFFTTKGKEKGTGLGLSVVYGIMQAHHGFVDVESEVGTGTCFYLYFPVPAESSESLTSIEQVEETTLGGNESILVVEDEELLLDMVQILLETNGYTVFSAQDGLQALEIFEQHQAEISLVITDMGLPKLTGVDEFEKLKEIDPNVKVVFASGYFEPDIRAKLEEAGAVGFLQKPYVIEQVLTKIREALARS
jgi:two-component system, cell cycle sensor histidine kinase and response regulator CckA